MPPTKHRGGKPTKYKRKENNMTLKTLIKAEIANLLLSLDFAVDREGEIDEKEITMQLTEAFTHFAHKTLEAVEEEIKKEPIGWYDEGEGLDIEFSAQEMKDAIIKIFQAKVADYFLEK